MNKWSKTYEKEDMFLVPWLLLFFPICCPMLFLCVPIFQICPMGVLLVLFFDGFAKFAFRTKTAQIWIEQTLKHGTI